LAQSSPGEEDCCVGVKGGGARGKNVLIVVLKAKGNIELDFAIIDYWL
jgi:hypothetical protein